MSKKNRIPSGAFDFALSYQNNYDKLLQITLSRYEWTGLPEEIDRRYIEMILHERGQILFSKDENLRDETIEGAEGYFCLPFALNGGLDIYRNPKGYQVWSSNGAYHVTKTNKEAVPIYNNYLRKGGEALLREYAWKLTDLDRTVFINAQSQRHPFLLVTDEKNHIALQKCFTEVIDGEPAIYTYADPTKEGMKVLDFATPYNCDKIFQLKVNVWNEYLTCIGIANVAVEKAERLISDEVKRSSGGTMASRYSPLDTRRFACEKINKMFGLDVWCDYRSESDTDILNDVGNSGKQVENQQKEYVENE